MIVCYLCRNFSYPEGIAPTCVLDDHYIGLEDKPFCDSFVPEGDLSLLDFM